MDKQVIENNHGFHYNKHLRPMLCQILGEHNFRIAETKFEQDFPGDLDSIRSDLGSLWRIRCALAHSDTATHARAQITVYAPSWTKNQYRVLSRRLSAFKTCVLDANQ